MVSAPSGTTHVGARPSVNRHRDELATNGSTAVGRNSSPWVNWMTGSKARSSARSLCSAARLGADATTSTYDAPGPVGRPLCLLGQLVEQVVDDVHRARPAPAAIPDATMSGGSRRDRGSGRSRRSLSSVHAGWARTAPDELEPAPTRRRWSAGGRPRPARRTAASRCPPTGGPR